MFQRTLLICICSSLLAAMTAPLVAQAESTAANGLSAASASAMKTPTDKLAATYSTFAGSDANAQALVTGLRNGTSVTLASGGTSTTFTPATKPMGFGGVNIALALAKTELQQLGITDPTPAQIQAALNGGTITTPTGTTTLAGVLQLRSEGKGWGQIANSLGLKLGEVVSASKTDKAMAHTSFGRPEKVERPQRPERIERPAR